MDITSLLNTNTPEPEEVAGSRTNTHVVPPVIEQKHSNSQSLPTALQQSGSNNSPLSSHSNKILGVRHTPPREQPPPLIIPPQLPPLTMSQIAYPAYSATPHYTLQQSPTLQSPPSAMTQSAVTDDSIELSGINKTYPCQECSKSFARKSDLVRHGR